MSSWPISCWAKRRPRASKYWVPMGCYLKVTKAVLERALAEEMTGHLG